MKLSIFVIFILISVFILFPLEGNTAYKVAPTIEDLTNGKVKIGDLVDKNNVDLVKEYLTLGFYGLVKKGMVMKMGKQIPAERFAIKAHWESTERNRGKAVLTEDKVVLLKDGSLWPGGVPFPEPKTADEVMANFKYGTVNSEYRHEPVWFAYINKKGERYKKVGQIHKTVFTNCRTKLAPLGAWPGYEDVFYKRLSVTTYPLEIKGLGIYQVRYYNEVKNYDTGFIYLPAFKRTMRISSTTWQDNVAGSDMIYGDAAGFFEPQVDWDFKLLKDKKYVLGWEPEAPFPCVDEKSEFDPRLKFDVGKKFPRVGWCIYPVNVVEATPKKRHIYSKRILYVNAYPYWPSSSNILVADSFDRQGKIWREFDNNNGEYTIDMNNNDVYHASFGLIIYDLQTDHSTQVWFRSYTDADNFKPADITLRSLLEVGR
jgi:hypothetical protein